MPARQTLKRALSAPLRRFFDHRFASVDASLRAIGTQTRHELGRDLRGTVDPLGRRLEQLAGEVATMSRRHVEALGYVATELRSLDARLQDLATAVARDRAVDVDVLAHPYAVRALAGLPAGARVLAIGFDLSETPLSLAAVGLEVTTVGRDPYPFEHPNLEALIGTPEDVDDRFAAVVWAPGAPDGARRLERSLQLLDEGGLVVLGARPGDLPEAPAGLEVVDRTAASRNGTGTWVAGADEEPSLVLLTARRA